MVPLRLYQIKSYINENFKSPSSSIYITRILLLFYMKYNIFA
uniref:Uncharacterized protein n=1 Tax=Arundo donax TaxID=35708 RepID=A0A0A9C4X9_ARUDO